MRIGEDVLYDPVAAIALRICQAVEDAITLRVIRRGDLDRAFPRGKTFRHH